MGCDGAVVQVRVAQLYKDNTPMQRHSSCAGTLQLGRYQGPRWPQAARWAQCTCIDTHFFSGRERRQVHLSRPDIPSLRKSLVQWYSPSPLWGLLYHFSGTAKSVLALLSSMGVAYTNEGRLRRLWMSHRHPRKPRLQRLRISCLLEGIRMCTSHRLDR
jgi:hypothetical protein